MDPKELSTANRPTSISDLPRYQLTPEVIFTLEDELAEDRDHLEFWAKVVDAARENPKLRVKGTQILRPLVHSDIEEKIKNAQDEYDRGRKRYQELLDGDEMKDYEWDAKKYAETENLTPVGDL